MNSRRWIFFSVPLLIAVLAGVVVTVPSLRESVQHRLLRTNREVLATAEGDLLNDGSKVKVVKYRGPEGILFVDVLKLGENGETKAVDHILLPDKHDGLFNFKGHVTRLAITDVEGDGQMKLLAPTFDNQLVPHLNVFRYNPDLGRFELYQPSK